MNRTTTSAAAVAQQAKQLLQRLEQRADPAIREQMERQFAIRTRKAFGMKMGELHALAKEIGRDHALAAALWKTGWYEARTLAVFIEEKARVTPAQMDRWAADFDNWAICDTACFHLFDRLPHAFDKVDEWARRPEEFVKRAAFALLASAALHRKDKPDAPFLRRLPLLERHAGDERNFVKKAILWALRGVGGRSPALRAAALALAGRLADSKLSATRWVGRNAIRELTKSAARSRPSP